MRKAITRRLLACILPFLPLPLSLGSSFLRSLSFRLSLLARCVCRATSLMCGPLSQVRSLPLSLVSPLPSPRKTDSGRLRAASVWVSPTCIGLPPSCAGLSPRFVHFAARVPTREERQRRREREREREREGTTATFSLSKLQNDVKTGENTKAAMESSNLASATLSDVAFARNRNN